MNELLTTERDGESKRPPVAALLQCLPLLGPLYGVLKATVGYAPVHWALRSDGLTFRQLL
jgi:hypothetical protein